MNLPLRFNPKFAMLSKAMLADRHYLREAETRRHMPVSVLLMIACTVAYGLQLVGYIASGYQYDPLSRYLALQPTGPSPSWLWQVFTFQFLHVNLLHLAGNILGLYMVGRPLEDQIGSKLFLWLYLASGVVGGLLQITCSMVFPMHFIHASVVGASAGVFGVVSAYCLLHWDESITMFFYFFPVTIKCKFLLLILAVFAVFGMLERASANGGMAHAAHLGGMLTGLCVVKSVIQSQSIWTTWFRRRPKATRRPAEFVKSRSVAESFWKRPEVSAFEDMPPTEFISREVDPILDKISAHGIQSLTERERRILEAARHKMTKQ